MPGCCAWARTSKTSGTEMLIFLTFSAGLMSGILWSYLWVVPFGRTAESYSKGSPGVKTRPENTGPPSRRDGCVMGAMVRQRSCHGS